MNATEHAAASAQVVVPCTDLDAALAFFCERLGFRLDMIMPADAPRMALVSGFGITLCLQAGNGSQAPTLRLCGGTPGHPPGSVIQGPGGVRVEFAPAPETIGIPTANPTFSVARGGEAAWCDGRAGMQYRDLIPGRQGGRFIASHIRIPDAGTVPDYVHYHQIRFQMIYCRSGWVRVVYEDQGEPFVMHAGDCVLQPPCIRHRVLEASGPLEVIEIGCPAEHATWRDHTLTLPTRPQRPQRRFDGQRFVRHVAADALSTQQADGFYVRDTGIGVATDGLADVRVLQAPAAASVRTTRRCGEFLFLFVLHGEARIAGESVSDQRLAHDDACTFPVGAEMTITATPASELLEVALPAYSMNVA